MFLTLTLIPALKMNNVKKLCIKIKIMHENNQLRTHFRFKTGFSHSSHWVQYRVKYEMHGKQLSSSKAAVSVQLEICLYDIITPELSLQQPCTHIRVTHGSCWVYLKSWCYSFRGQVKIHHHMVVLFPRPCSCTLISRRGNITLYFI